MGILKSYELVREVTFWCRLAGQGWIEAGIYDGANHAFPTASYLSDALGDLTRTVVSLLEGAEAATCSWEEEPGEFQWVFARDSEALNLRILWFEDQFERQPEDPGELRFSTRCTPMRLACQLRDQLRRLLEEVGTDRYQREWRFPFPWRSTSS